MSIENKTLKDYENGVLEIFKSRLELFKKKNSNYGSAWIKSGDILNYMVDHKKIILNDEDDINVIELFGRILEKMIRFANLRFVGETDKVGETTMETMGDIGVIAFMISEHEKNKL